MAKSHNGNHVGKKVKQMSWHFGNRWGYICTYIKSDMYEIYKYVYIYICIN